ncbi:oxidoreductase [Defluviimonas sp. 20V17]|uniref:Gamma-glutamylputrescine oxidase n=1 Tax=Allgaiera indica TaxID=765699 RepID=A0AAN4UPE5_9RHOB|nr:FAD-binding oxidoreductase [Allgaiera indica]KDB03768.1 oxidoreductase [Defluviimonas sp. 20V17]GHD99975.1 gamma-glutamylputrescine oxidase [Allgaiera indica]SDW39561.1 gamma-glutamylputrescine oxidase [Allgaiera indica]
MNLLHANDKTGAYPGSWYAATATPARPYPPLRGAVKADVCIVGAGFTGLSAALHLAKAGLDVVVLEAHRVGFGASGRNGGQVGSGQRLGQDRLEAQVGRDDAHRLWQMAEDAKQLIRDLIAEHDMPVTFHKGVAVACRHKSEVAEAHAYAEKLARDYGYDRIEPLDRAGIADLTGSDAYAGGEVDRGAGHIHPLNFALGLARAATEAGARFHELSEVTGLHAGPPHLVRLDRAEVRADHVILACNGYLGGLEPRVARRVMPINNFIVATEPLGKRWAEILPSNAAVYDSRFVVNYWRRSDDGRLLFGGGESYGYRFPRDIAATVRGPMIDVYPQLRDLRIDYAWGGTLGITRTRLPCFYRRDRTILSASGYSGHGVALATIAGKILAETVAGQAGDFDLMARLPMPAFPGGQMLRYPLLVLAMSWFALRDRIGM